MNEWDTPEVPMEETTLAKMDEMATKIRDARLEYEKRSKEKTEAHNALELLERDMVNLLKAHNRKSYKLPGVGTVGFSIREQYTTPKNNLEKESLFKYILDKYGKETLTGMLSINSMTLNAWANKEVETGEVQQIPGLAQPTATEVFSFRKG